MKNQAVRDRKVPQGQDRHVSLTVICQVCPQWWDPRVYTWIALEFTCYWSHSWNSPVTGNSCLCQLLRKRRYATILPWRKLWNTLSLGAGVRFIRVLGRAKLEYSKTRDSQRHSQKRVHSLKKRKNGIITTQGWGSCQLKDLAETQRERRGDQLDTDENTRL